MRDAWSPAVVRGSHWPRPSRPTTEYPSTITSPRESVVRAMYDYAAREVESGNALRHITRHMLGLYYGERRARLWRQMLSDPARLSQNDPALLLEAFEAAEAAAALARAA